MVDVNVLASYLVKLGFKIETPELQKFQSTLQEVRVQVERVTEGMAKNFVKAGATIIGAFASIGAAAVGMADHVAKADLDFQLLGRRMFMTTEAARRMKIATDAPAYSL